MNRARIAEILKESEKFDGVARRLLMKADENAIVELNKDIMTDELRQEIRKFVIQIDLLSKYKLKFRVLPQPDLDTIKFDEKAINSIIKISKATKKKYR